MKTTFKFSIQNLLTRKEDTVSGPMSPFLFAKEMAKAADFKFNRMARVWFEDEEIFQHYEADGLTGHDTLLIGCQYQNDLWVSLWVDSGTGGLPVAMCYQSDKEILLTPVYAKATFARSLTKEEITEIFNHVFDNPHEIAITDQ